MSLNKDLQVGDLVTFPYWKSLSAKVTYCVGTILARASKNSFYVYVGENSHAVNGRNHAIFNEQQLVKITGNKQ